MGISILNCDCPEGGGGGGDVTKVGTPVNNQVGVWTGDRLRSEFWLERVL